MHRTKICGMEELAGRLARLAGQGHVTGLAHGCFDLLHLGHVRYLAQARAQCDFLAVSVTPDEFVGKGPHRPVFTAPQRAEVLAALCMVDAVVVNRWPTAVEALLLLRPTRYFKGQDRQAELDDPATAMHAEAAACRGGGGEVVFLDDLVFSSTSIARLFYSPLLDNA